MDVFKMTTRGTHCVVRGMEKSYKQELITKDKHRCGGYR